MQASLHSKHSMPLNAAIIVAAGSSQRFGEDKLMTLVQGRPLISYSIQTFAELPSIQEMILVVPIGREEAFDQLLQGIGVAEMDKKINIVPGGASRYESVQRGLRALSDDIEWVSIHDAARPLIARSMVELTFQKAREHGAASLATRVTDTLHQAHENNLTDVTIDRTHLWAMQTPQVFRKADLINLPSPEKNKNFTDEVSALLERGIKTYLVENRELNIKVTYPEDLKLVSSFLTKKK